MANELPKEPNQGASPKQKPHALVAPETELEVLRARQRLALTFGVIALLLVLLGGGIAFLLMRQYQQGLIQVPTAEKPPAPTFLQAPQTPSPSSPSFVQVPQAQPPESGLLQAPPPPPTPVPLQTVQPAVPQPVPSQQPTLPVGLWDYLEQLRRIEQQRKNEANNFWIALQSLWDLLKALQGVAATGDPLEAPNYDPQANLKAYDAYQQRFSILHQALRQLKPPPECWSLHQAYDQALQTHINAIVSLKQRILAKDLLGAAFGLTLQKQIDNALAAADNELAAICYRFGIAKPFTIGDK